MDQPEALVSERHRSPHGPMSMNECASPRLSVIVTARNDNHGGNLLRRMQIFVDALVQQAERHGVHCELIIVEWNPPPEAARLAEALAWPSKGGGCTVRIIEVPAEVHRRYKFSDRVPLFQMIAKNVGVRRARGQYVLCTNVDLVFSDELVRFLASGHLDPSCMYRVDRLDVPAAVPQGVPVAEQLEYCRQNVIRFNTRWGTFDAGATLWSRIRTMLRLLTSRESSVRGAPRGHATATLMRTLSLPRRVMRRLVLNRAGGGWFKPLHTNACGDFTLLARERWEQLRGYPEVEMFSFHLDSILCHMAVLLGTREVVLGRRLCAYHIEHASGWSPQEGERLFRRMGAMGVPTLDAPTYYAWVDRMKRDRCAIVVNDEHWGLGREHLSEIDLPLSSLPCTPVATFATAREKA